MIRRCSNTSISLRPHSVLRFTTSNALNYRTPTTCPTIESPPAARPHPSQAPIRTSSQYRCHAQHPSSRHTCDLHKAGLPRGGVCLRIRPLLGQYALLLIEDTTVVLSNLTGHLTRDGRDINPFGCGHLALHRGLHFRDPEILVCSVFCCGGGGNYAVERGLFLRVVREGGLVGVDGGFLCRIKTRDRD